MVHLLQDWNSIENLQKNSSKSVQSHTCQPTHLYPVWAGDGFVLLFMSCQPDPAQTNSRRVSQKLLKFTCFLVNNLGGENWGVKQRIFTHQTDLALISTIFIHWECNFTRSTTMHTEKILFMRRRESGKNSTKNKIQFDA